ncbi:hypothetical protein HYFRA_00003306 [Hymenoscyphus fraxineus]|uniref:FAD-binding domain-containing protein n=1 Tax=Hymenoscyphus fraxineus TaxID=746836 RepID=A0A9N9KTD4_9HELO|nr:hypothetical protein HYFRA_00003306 [Hymenoscyphus fraxineus]
MPELLTEVPEPIEPFRIIIIGAGLGGVATAIGLRKAGHDVVLLERMLEFPNVSAGLHLSPNGCRALSQLGLLPSIENHAIPLEAITLRSYSDGSILRSLSLLPDMMVKYGMPYLAVHRFSVHKSLEDEARAIGVQFEMGAMVLSIDFNAPAVVLKTGRIIAGDLVIGSDGEGSQCRSLLLGRPDPPHHFGHLHRMFVCDISQDVIRRHEDLRDLLDAPDVPYWLGPASLCIGSITNSHGDFNLIGGLEEPITEKVRNRPEVSDMMDIKDFYKNWDPKLRKLLDLAPFCLKWTLTTIPDLDEWTHPKGKFTLLGDSAHAMTPYLAQGASQCLEDAVVLSRLLSHAKHRSQIPNILKTYEGLRKPRVLKLKRRSEEMREMYCMKDGSIQEERDHQLRDHEPYSGYVIPWMDPDYQNWIYGYDAGKEADAAWKLYMDGKIL